MIEATDITCEELSALYQLGQLTDPTLVGEQALRLGQLGGVEGAVLPADALQLFLERLDWQSPLLQDFPHLQLHLNLDQPDHLQAVAEAIQTSIAVTELPLTWCQNWVEFFQASGLTAHNGLCLTPSLWCPPDCDSPIDLITPQYCWLTAPDLADGIKRLWQQLFQAQILYLWEQQGFTFEHLKLAVILQPLESTAVSGWLHVTPETISIQAVPGLHLGGLQGQPHPDLFQIDRCTGAVRRQVGEHSYAYNVSTYPGDVVTVQSLSPPQTTLLNADLEVLSAWGTDLAGQMEVEVFSVRWSIPQGSASRIQLHEVALESPWLVAIPDAAESETLVSGLPAAPGRAIAPAIIIQHLQAQPPDVVVGKILVVPDCQPTDLPWLRQATGLICETGGLTSHGAILARELGLPAVVGVSKATTLIQPGQLLELDGERGIIRPGQHSSAKPPLPLQPPHPDLSLTTQLWVTLSQIDQVEAVSQLPVDGVGLLRSEWLFLDMLKRHHPQQWILHGQAEQLIEQLVERLQIFLDAFAPRPVFYRTLAGTSRELGHLEGGEEEPLETNPALGQRGVARYQADPRLFDCELAALARLQDRGNLRLLLPFVRSVEEFCWCRDRISAAGLSSNVEVWMMAEVPSVLFLLEDYVKAGVQGIAIGSNDLTQLILGLDRDQPLLDPSLNVGHPAVMAAISQLIQAANALDIPCSLCGQVPTRDFPFLEKLVQWGITALSVEMQAVAQARRTLAEVEQRQQ